MSSRITLHERIAAWSAASAATPRTGSWRRKPTPAKAAARRKKIRRKANKFLKKLAA